MIRAIAPLTALTLLMAGCAMPPPQGITPYQPTVYMTQVLASQAKLGARPIESLSPEAARLNPSIADGVHSVQTQLGQPLTPMPVGSYKNISLQGAAGPIGARVYTPANVAANAPVILYFHGGGWVISTIDTYDSSARALANGANAIVISVEYRKAPENRFPAAHDDAIAAYKWTLANAASLGGDPRRIALAGESAGGNMAITTAIAARDQRLPMPVHELLVYPVASTDLTLPSVVENAKAKPLGKATLEWFVKYYTNSPADLQDPRLNVVGTPNLAGLPPTTIVLAQIDPLRSGGELLAQKLTAAGVPTEVRTYAGVTHEFFGTGAVVPTGQEAVGYASGRLRQSFAALPLAMQPAPMAMMPTRAGTLAR
ncbi:MAG: alpha/beta hydrolase fold domain-containing protein [Janthinobacterium lividum]